jgi:heme-degrading monooxygenase HmoA
VWRGRVHNELLDEYRDHIASTGLADYRNTPGNRGAYMFTAPSPEGGDVVTLSFWKSKESIVAFAGDDIDRARFYPDDDRFLTERGERVEHFDVTF